MSTLKYFVYHASAIQVGALPFALPLWRTVDAAGPDDHVIGVGR